MIAWVAIGVLVLLLMAEVLLFRELLFARDLSVWEKERFAFISAVFSEANIIRSVPDHSGDFVRAGDNVLVGPDRVMANFNVLKEMLWLMLEMESERRAAVNRMSKKIDELAVWEFDNPQPEPPTYFGHRLAFG